MKDNSNGDYDDVNNNDDVISFEVPGLPENAYFTAADKLKDGAEVYLDKKLRKRMTCNKCGNQLTLDWELCPECRECGENG